MKLNQASNRPVHVVTPAPNKQGKVTATAKKVAGVFNSMDEAARLGALTDGRGAVKKLAQQSLRAQAKTIYDVIEAASARAVLSGHDWHVTAAVIAGYYGVAGIKSAQVVDAEGMVQIVALSAPATAESIASDALAVAIVRGGRAEGEKAQTRAAIAVQFAESVLSSVQTLRAVTVDAARANIHEGFVSGQWDTQAACDRLVRAGVAKDGAAKGLCADWAAARDEFTNIVQQFRAGLTTQDEAQAAVLALGLTKTRITIDEEQAA
jgi:hypothetical protein